MVLNFEEILKDEEPIQKLKQQLLRLQEPMNAVIDRGDSPVQQFYRGATVLVTGGSGFIGKQFIEKLFRSCDIKTMYVLMRPRKGKTAQQRKEYILKDPVFDQVRAKKPDFADRIVPVEGDVAELRLGLSEKEWDRLTEEVDTIFHGAATVHFNAPLKVATLTNVRGTRETLTLARSCKNLKNYIYTSTAYTHATYKNVGQEVLEQFYECPVPPEMMIQMAETFAVERLDNLTPGMIKNWPNTYSFTKALAEELIRQSSDLPVCVVKPPIVTGAYYEPSPGWLDMNTIQGPSGLMLGILLGVLHVFYVNIDSNMETAPVDYVNNCTIAAAWDAAQRRRRGDSDVPIYIVANKNRYLSWRQIHDNFTSEKGRRFASPLAVGYCFTAVRRNQFYYKFLSFIWHYLPAYLADSVCYVIGKKPKQIKSFVDIFRTIDKFADIFDYFLTNTWDFKDDNVQAMMSNMNDADRAIYNCDIKTIDTDDLTYAWGLGIREFLIKDGLVGDPRIKQRILRIAHYVYTGLVFYIIWKILCLIWSISFNVCDMLI